MTDKAGPSVEYIRSRNTHLQDSGFGHIRTTVEVTVLLAALDVALADTKRLRRELDALATEHTHGPAPDMRPRRYWWTR